MDTWEQILLAFGGNAILLLVLGFLARSLLQTWLTKDVKKFETDLRAGADSQLEHLKYELKAQGDASIEQLKSALQIAAAERQMRFSNLHARRAEVIADLYRKAVDVEREGRIYIYKFGRDSENEQREAGAVAALREFDIFADQHRSYLSDKICQLLAGFSGLLNEPVVHARVYGNIQHPTPEIIKEGYHGFIKTIEAFQKDIPAARRELEREFRDILGVFINAGSARRPETGAGRGSKSSAGVSSILSARRQD